MKEMSFMSKSIISVLEGNVYYVQEYHICFGRKCLLCLRVSYLFRKEMSFMSKSIISA